MATRSAPRSPSRPYSGTTLIPTVLETGSPAFGPHTLSSKDGTPSAVRSMPKTSQMVPNSNGETSGSTSAATLDSMPAA
jgi:hypothetical protein